MDQPVPLNDDPVPPSTSQYHQVTNINKNNDNYNNNYNDI